MNTHRLKSARLRKGLAQTDISKQLGVSPSLAGQWERGDKMPSTPHLAALAKLLEVSVSWLLDEGVAEHPKSYEKEQPSGRAAILADYLAPPGLRKLASNAELIKALDIQPAEWAALRSLQAPSVLTVNGYLAVLLAIRGSVSES